MQATEGASCRRAGRPRDARTDVAVLQAVLDLAAEHGLAHLSMDAVAARAGVAKATIYRRWPSKEALIIESWRCLIAPVETPDTGTLRGDIELMLSTLLDNLDGRGFDMLAQVAAAARSDEALASALQEFLAARRQPMRAVLQRYIDRGVLAADLDVDLVADTIVGPLLYRLMLSRSVVDAAVLRSVIDIVLGGVERLPEP
ncbi:MAG: TetR/AcrR family transcriptional regulator [Acidimicrobiia bacterium]